MNTYQEFCRLRDLHTPGANAPKHTEAEAFFMAAAQLAVPAGYKLVPLEPTPEIIAGAAVASWPTANPADIALARLAAPIVLMHMDMAPSTTVEAVAGMLATMAPAYRAMLAAAPWPPAGAESKHSPLPAAAQVNMPVDAAKANFWFDCLYKCATLLELSGDTPIPSGVVNAVEKLVAAQVSPIAAIPQEEASMRYPATMTAALADVLGLMNFRTGPIAHVYRAAGSDIRTKCEDEQAFVLDRFLRLALEHGDNWRTAAEADLKAAHTLAEASKAVES